MGGGFFLYGEFNLGGTGVGDFGLGKAQHSLKVMLDFMESILYWTMKQRDDLVDVSDYCLANPGTEYVVYTEASGPITLDLTDALGTMSVEWIDPIRARGIRARNATLILTLINVTDLSKMRECASLGGGRGVPLLGCASCLGTANVYRRRRVAVCRRHTFLYGETTIRSRSPSLPRFCWIATAPGSSETSPTNAIERASGSHDV
jgi:hypothetical protein